MKFCIVIPGREQSERTRNLKIPGSRFARPGMTVIVGDAGLIRQFRFAAGDRALFRKQRPLDARLDETIQHLDDDAALFFDDGWNRAVADWRCNLLKRKNRHRVSPRVELKHPGFPQNSLDERLVTANGSIPSNAARTFQA